MIPVFYRHEQSVASNESYSPSAGKPEKAVKDWLSNTDISPFLLLKSFEPATREQLYEAHDRDYVDGVLDCEIANGFHNHSKQVADSLLYTVGSMIAAVDDVLRSDRLTHHRVAVSPTSGFHHAGYDHGGGYCTFNGLVAAAIHAKKHRHVRRVAIFDLDQHFGDGTQHIIDKLGLDWIDHYTHGQGYKTVKEAHALVHSNSRAYRKDIDLVLFQAGADIHADDPLGGLMTTEEMQERDRRVFWHGANYDMPVVWNLAGGYQRDAAGTIEPVLALHRQTMIECIKQYGG